ncbi:MAG: winged helix-turn-helix domain-containing protein [Phycisphaerae bacterium]
MIHRSEPSILSRWKRWGVSFHVPPSPQPCSVEQLLVDTAEELHTNARLFALAVTWLTQNYPIVDVERLSQRAVRLHGDASARLGLLLETAEGWIGAGVFQQAVEVCHPAETPKPLFAAEAFPPLAELVRKQASEISLRWGLWARPMDRLKVESLRPASWIAQHNQTYRLRWLFRGDVRSRVVTALMEEQLPAPSEADLTRFAGCTRKAMHSALDNLESAGLITRKRQGRRYVISVA